MYRQAVDSNALILDTANHRDVNTEPAVEKPPKLSKSQLRKQKQVQEELANRHKRAEVAWLNAVFSKLMHGKPGTPSHSALLVVQVYASLQQHALSDAQHAFIMPAHMLGQSETKRQQLRRALHHQQAGIAQPVGAQLEKERHVETAELDPLSAAQVTFAYCLSVMYTAYLLCMHSSMPKLFIVPLLRKCYTLQAKSATVMWTSVA